MKSNPFDQPKLKWPRAIEADPSLEQLETLFNKNQAILWNEGSVKVAKVALTPEFEKALMSMNGLKQLERGLENIEGILSSEKKGIDAQVTKQGMAPANRMSRLLVIANGGSERFYRGCERLLIDHSDRLLGVRVDVSSAIERLYGPDALAKALLISHRDAVTRALWALIP